MSWQPMQRELCLLRSRLQQPRRFRGMTFHGLAACSRAWGVTPFWAAGYVLLLALALATPQDVLQRLPQAQPLVSFMSAWNPQIRALGEMKVPLAAANQFAYAVLWCLMPVYWVALVRAIFRRHQPDYVLVLGSRVQHFLLIAAAAGFFIVFTDLNDSTRLGVLAFGNQVARSIVAPFAVFFAGFSVIAFILYSLALVTGRVRYRSSGDQKHG